MKQKTSTKHVNPPAAKPLLAAVKISLSRYWQWSKCFVCGNYLSNPERQIQEVLETIYYLGWIRVTIRHTNKFVCR